MTVADDGPVAQPPVVLGAVRVAAPVRTGWTQPPTDPTSGGSPTGGAGGVLSGQYPNPGFAVNMATQAELDGHVAAPAPHPAYDDMPSLTLLFQNGLT